ncbi:MAG: ABC transporter permease [Bacteroidota bacterium]|jgi:ABC-2 type transport system permease protein|nr:ABC transporter permease [Sphingobacteriales bacterium]
MLFYKIKNLYQLVYTIALKNIKVKYKNSVLGYMWSLLHPLAYLIIFIFVFSQAFANIERYPLYALVGLIFWTYFNNSMNQIINSIINNASIIKTIALPNILFPLSAAFAELVTMLLSLIPFFSLMLFFGLQITWHTALVVPAIFVYAIFTIGIGTLMGTFNVFFRDIGILWNTLSPALFYFTPIAYLSNLIPEKYQAFVQANPLYHYMTLFRDILFYNQMPSSRTIIITCLMAFVTFTVGLFMFNRYKKGFVSNL